MIVSISFYLFHKILPKPWSDKLLLKYWCCFLCFIDAFPNYLLTLEYIYRYISAVATIFRLGGLVRNIILRIKTEKCLSHACFWLKVPCIAPVGTGRRLNVHKTFNLPPVPTGAFFFFLNMNKIKALKRRYKITQKFGLTHFNVKNKYSLFGRTLAISITMLQWTHASYKTSRSQTVLRSIKVYESRYKHRTKISTEKLFISSFNT